MYGENPFERAFRGAGPRGGRRGGPHGGHHGGPHGGRGGRSRGWQQADLPAADDAPAWLAGRLPDDWFVGAPTVTVDREEIVVVGELPTPESSSAESSSAEGSSAESSSSEDGTNDATAQGRIGRFREDTRDARIRIAEEAEARYGRKVAWGASIGDTHVMFSHLAVPVMTRLRHQQRRVLDTLVDAGVARSRSDALAWCVDLVGQHTDEWLANLREAMTAVDKVRAEGPDV